MTLFQENFVRLEGVCIYFFKSVPLKESKVLWYYTNNMTCSLSAHVQRSSWLYCNTMLWCRSCMKEAKLVPFSSDLTSPPYIYSEYVLYSSFRSISKSSTNLNMIFYTNPKLMNANSLTATRCNLPVQHTWFLLHILQHRQAGLFLVGLEEQIR